MVGWRGWSKAVGILHLPNLDLYFIMLHDESLEVGAP